MSISLPIAIWLALEFNKHVTSRPGALPGTRGCRGMPIGLCPEVTVPVKATGMDRKVGAVAKHWSYPPVN